MEAVINILVVMSFSCGTFIGYCRVAKLLIWLVKFKAAASSKYVGRLQGKKGNSGGV
jgi:hypothetical protein